jgi:hypothetical protein
MEYENRLLCNQMDKAFAPKTIFKAGTAEAMTKFQLATYGDYCVVGPGIDAMQNPIQGFLQDGLAMYRTSADLMRSNLSASRQQVAPEKPGNPVTAFEKRAEISEQSSLSATTFNHHYKEMDCLYGEIVRRLCNLNSTDERAQRYQERCEEAGVPKECFGRIVSVKAVRVTGQGSPFMRQQSLMGLQGVVMGCPEDGQNNWRNDVIAAYSGQNAVSRYNPPPGSTKLATDQRERANTQIGLMKLGQQATITSSQNATTFAGAFLDACISALQSVQKGADPKEVVGFLELAAPAAQAHIKRMINDPMRKQIAEALLERWQQVAKLTDRLKQQIQQSADEQKAQQAKQQQAMSDEQIKQQQAEHGMQLKTAKTQHQLQERNVRTQADLADKAARTRQDLAISDATAAAEIHERMLKPKLNVRRRKRQRRKRRNEIRRGRFWPGSTRQRISLQLLHGFFWKREKITFQKTKLQILIRRYVGLGMVFLLGSLRLVPFWSVIPQLVSWPLNLPVQSFRVSPKFYQGVKQTRRVLP